MASKVMHCLPGCFLITREATPSLERTATIGVRHIVSLKYMPSVKTMNCLLFQPAFKHHIRLPQICAVSESLTVHPLTDPVS